MVSRRFIPPEQRLDPVVASLGQLRELEQLVGVERHLGRLSPEAPVDQVLLDGEVLVEDVALRTHAQPRADRGPVGCRVETQDGQLAPADRRHATDHAHRRRLARAVGPEEAERLATAHLDVDAVDRGEVAEPLGQPPGAEQDVVAHRTVPSPAPDSAPLSSWRACRARAVGPPARPSRRTARTTRRAAPSPLERLERRAPTERRQVRGTGERVRVGSTELVLGEGPEPRDAHGRMVCRASTRVRHRHTGPMRLITAAGVPASLARVPEPGPRPCGSASSSTPGTPTVTRCARPCATASGPPPTPGPASSSSPS